MCDSGRAHGRAIAIMRNVAAIFEEALAATRLLVSAKYRLVDARTDGETQRETSYRAAAGTAVVATTAPCIVCFLPAVSATVPTCLQVTGLLRLPSDFSNRVAVWQCGRVAVWASAAPPGCSSVAAPRSQRRCPTQLRTQLNGALGSTRSAPDPSSRRVLQTIDTQSGHSLAATDAAPPGR